MNIRTFVQDDLEPLIALTIDTFGPYYEEHFRPLVGDVVFVNQHGSWREDYRTLVTGLHDPDRHQHVAVAVDEDDAAVGYVAWKLDPDRRNAVITVVAVAADRRRRGAAGTLCEHAFDHMRTHGAEVVEIGTGGDPFHRPARALYEHLGCTPVPVTVYYRQL